MFKLIDTPRVKFINYRFILVAVSGVCIIGGITNFAIRGNKKYDIDFTGGTLVHVHLKEQTSPSVIRNGLSDIGYGEAEVQSIWSGENLTQFVSTADEFGIRIKELNEEKVRQKTEDDIKGVLDKSGISSKIRFIEPTIFNLELSKPVDEIDIQKSLKLAGYSNEDVVSITSVNQPAKEYRINVAGLDDVRKRLQSVDAIIEVLKDNLIYHDVRVKLGDVVETLNTQDIAMRISKPFIDVEVSEPIEPILFNLELKKNGYADVVVTKHPEEAEKMRTNKLRIEGARKNLADIKQSAKEVVSIPSVYCLGNEAIQVVLKEGFSKENFVAIIIRNKLIKIDVKNIYAMNAPAQLFLIQLQPLNTGKIQEKIKDDVKKSRKR